jgi:hypothetical protein
MNKNKESIFEVFLVKRAVLLLTVIMVTIVIIIENLTNESNTSRTRHKLALNDT